MPVGDDAIAAPTAALIYQFRECVYSTNPLEWLTSNNQNLLGVKGLKALSSVDAVELANHNRLLV